MNTETQSILKSINRLPEPEKRELAAEIIRLTANLDFPPLTDEDLVLAAEERFIELDRAEAKDAKSKSRRGPAS